MAPLPYIDIHTHLPGPEKETVSVKNLFPGENIPEFTGRNFYSMGLHPWYIKSKDENNEFLCLVEDALELDHVIFAGETGPDPKAGTSFNEQMRVFEAQAFMAEEYEKPLIIHCVKAYNEVIRIYNKLQPQQPWILHSYNGNLETTRKLEKGNFLFSFGHQLFNVNSKAIESFNYLPLHRIFFETDEKGSEVEEVFKKGAEIRKIKLERLKELVWQNFNRIENVKWIG